MRTTRITLMNLADMCFMSLSLRTL